MWLTYSVLTCMYFVTKYKYQKYKYWYLELKHKYLKFVLQYHSHY